MHSSLIATPRIKKGAASDELFYVDATAWLDTTETISSVTSTTISTVSGTSSTALATANTAALVAAHTYEGCGGNDETIAIGQGLQYECSGGTYGCVYLITFVVVTSEGETLEFGQEVEL